MKKQVLIGSLILGSLTLSLAAGCGGLDTATTADSTTSSTSSNQVIPKSVTVSPTEGSASASVSKAAGETEPSKDSRDGEYGFAIQMGEDLAKDTNAILDSILGLLSALEIPRSKDLTQLEKTLPLPEKKEHSEIPESHREKLGKEVTIKVDFSAFDLNNDGVKEKCSGNTAAVPVCYRVWVNGKKTLAGVVSELPSDSSAGRGELRANATAFCGNEFEMAAVYNHLSGSKKTDLYANGKVDDNFALKGGHIDSAQDANNKKLIKMSVDFASYKGGLESIRYIGQWLNSGTNWSGSVTIQPGTNITNACAVRLSGAAAPAADCVAEGIDTTKEAFTRLGTEADYGFPTDMSEEPTL